MDPVVRTLWGKTAAGKDEQDDWKPVRKAGKSYADAVKKREKQIPIKPEGLHSSHWKGTVVELADFISRVSITSFLFGCRGTARA